MGNVSALIPCYKSKAEEDWSIYGSIYLEAEFQQRTNHLRYEPFTFNLPGGKYTPDFYHLLQDGRVVLVEVKAQRLNKQGKQIHQRSYASSRNKLRAAASLFPEFTWMMATGSGEDWEVERL